MSKGISAIQRWVEGLRRSKRCEGCQNKDRCPTGDINNHSKSRWFKTVFRYDKDQNRLVNQQGTSNWKSIVFEKSRAYILPILISSSVADFY